MQAVALLQMIQLFGGSADNLEYNGDCAAFTVVVRYCQGNPFAVFVYAEDDELTRLRFFGNQRSLDVHESHCGIQFSLFQDFIHIHSSIPIGIIFAMM